VVGQSSCSLKLVLTRWGLQPRPRSAGRFGRSSASLARQLRLRSASPSSLWLEALATAKGAIRLNAHGDIPRRHSRPLPRRNNVLHIHDESPARIACSGVPLSQKELVADLKPSVIAPKLARLPPCPDFFKRGWPTFQLVHLPRLTHSSTGHNRTEARAALPSRPPSPPSGRPPRGPRT